MLTAVNVGKLMFLKGKERKSKLVLQHASEDGRRIYDSHSHHRGVHSSPRHAQHQGRKNVKSSHSTSVGDTTAVACDRQG